MTEAEAAAAAEDDAQAAAVARGAWAFQQLADDLCYDVLDPAWHVRHGAALALRELLRSQAGAAGVEAPVAAEASGQCSAASSASVSCLRIRAAGGWVGNLNASLFRKRRHSRCKVQRSQRLGLNWLYGGYSSFILHVTCLHDIVCSQRCFKLQPSRRLGRVRRQRQATAVRRDSRPGRRRCAVERHLAGGLRHPPDVRAGAGPFRRLRVRPG